MTTKLPNQLTDSERKLMQKMLAAPESFPGEFWSSIINKVQMDIGKLPGSQIVGGVSNLRFGLDGIATSQSTSSSSYTDLSTVGPTLSGISNGSYLIMFGAVVSVVASVFNANMSIQVNDTSATDADCIQVGFAGPEGPGVESSTLSGMRAVLKTLDADNNNTITCKYKGNGIGASFLNRWLFYIKVGN